jgi:large subunit ribosomal protein L18
MTKRSRKFLRIMRHKRIRKKLFGTADMPRLSVFRSNKHIYVQLINDNDGHTLTSANDSQLTTKNNIEKAEDVGALIAKNAKEIGVKKIVFDKSGYKYTGRVRALAEAMRKEGLDF